jgi:hypothetical protein
MAHSQKLLEGMARGFDHLVAGRADMLSVVRQLTAIKGGSSLRVIDFGCPNGLEERVAMPAAAQAVPAI